MASDLGRVESQLVGSLSLWAHEDACLLLQGDCFCMAMPAYFLFFSAIFKETVAVDSGV